MIDQKEVFYVGEAMERFGGSFVKALGKTLLHADPNNQQRIKDTWPKYWKQYLEVSRARP